MKSTVGDDVWQQLAGRIDGELLATPGSRRLYATDASPYAVVPAAVARPRNTEDCRRLVAYCAEHKLSLIARGGGTGLAGQCVGAGLILDCSRYLNRVVALDTEHAWVDVEPGVVPETLNRMLARHGLMFGPDPSTLNRCTIGGMFGNNAWGAHAPRDGSTRDNIAAVDAILSDASTASFAAMSPPELAKHGDATLEGRIYRGLDRILTARRDEILQAYPDPAAVCNNAGYALDWLARSAPWTAAGPACNLAPFLCGSEGTLALVTRLRLQLRPRPQARQLLCAHFDQLPAALAAVGPILDFQPAAVELLDDRVLRLTASNPAQRPRRFWIKGQPAAVLLIEFSGDAAAVAAGTAAAAAMLGASAACYARVIVDDERIDAVWALRRAGLGLLMGLPGPRRAVTGLEDSAVPVPALADYIAMMQAQFDREGVECVMYGSVARGLVHLRPLLDLDEGEDRERYRRLLEFEAAAAKSFGGCISTKHGDGRLRAHCLSRQFGQPVADLLGAIKHLFDPNAVFNPGKIVDPAPLLGDLRSAAAAVDSQVGGLDWTPAQDFAAAASQCQGAGACRKLSEGAMCPSYRASGEESLSTRGRANLLRQTLADADPWSDPELAASLESCLACKSCRSECPANVDMAALKIEYLHRRNRRHGLPLRARAVAEFARLSGWGAMLPQLSNRLGAWAPLKRALGVAADRELPRFAARSCSAWWREQQAQTRTPQADADLVILLDPYTEYFEPEIGMAALQLLRAMGLRPLLSPCLPSGRTALSQGAITIACRQLKSLLHQLPGALPIVALEPSELLCLREDALRLPLPGEAPGALQALSARAWLLDEFLAQDTITPRLLQLARAHRSAKTLDVLVHTHCHQRALADAELTVNLLQQLPAIQASSLKASCCGMAGDFGYQQNNYELSIKVGEQSLFPQIREHDDTALILANGFSCRHQISHGTGRRARHLASVLADACAIEIDRQVPYDSRRQRSETP